MFRIVDDPRFAGSEFRVDAKHAFEASAGPPPNIEDVKREVRRACVRAPNSRACAERASSYCSRVRKQFEHAGEMEDWNAKRLAEQEDSKRMQLMWSIRLVPRGISLEPAADTTTTAAAAPHPATGAVRAYRDCDF